MTDQELNAIISWCILGLALATLTTLTATGMLRGRTLAAGPTRDLGLDPRVYRAGVLLVGVFAALMLTRLRQPEQQIVALLTTLAPFVIVGLLIAYAQQVDDGPRKVGLLPRQPRRDLRWGLLAIPVGYILANAAGIVTHLIDTPTNEIGHSTLQDLQQDPTPERILVISFYAVVMAPLLEELTFRGVLQTCLLRLFHGRRWAALLVTAAVFSVIHFWVITSWHGLVPLFVLGLVFGYVYERTGSLLTPVLTHAGFNAINIALVLMMPATTAAPQ